MLERIACSEAMIWLYSEWFTVFPLAFLFLGLYALRVWDSFQDYDREEGVKENASI